MIRIERKFLPYDEFLRYLSSNKATAVDLVVRDPRGRVYLENRIEEPRGWALPGTVSLPGEDYEELAYWVAKEECGLRPDDVKNKYLGSASDNDDERDLRGKMRHQVFEMLVGDESPILEKCDGIDRGFFSGAQEGLIPSHRKLFRELGVFSHSFPSPTF